MRSVQAIAVTLAAVVVLSITLTIWWRFTPTRPLDVFVYDQTVANDQVPDHAVLEQLLDYHRVPYDAETNYVGANPDGSPHGEWPTERPDLIFLADLYGLYVDDSGQLSDEGRIRITDRLSQAQAEDIASWVEAGTPAYAEFGLVTEPNSPDVGLVLQDVFGFQDTGWAIKPFDDLANVSPQLRELGPRPWPYEGPGWLMVRLATPGSGALPQLTVFTEGMLAEPKPLVVGGPPGSGGGEAWFGGWIGIVQPDPDTAVDAWIELGFTESGRELAAAVGLPTRFPAVLRTENTLYFVGDGLDDETPFRLRKLTGGATFTRLVTSNEYRFLYQVLEPSVGWMLDRLDESGD